MFTISRDPQFTAEVKVQMPTLAGPQEMAFTARFRALPQSELEAIGVSTSEEISDFVRRVLLGWEDVVDEAGKAVAFSAEMRDALLEIPAARVPLLVAYRRAITGAARGN